VHRPIAAIARADEYRCLIEDHANDYTVAAPRPISQTTASPTRAEEGAGGWGVTNT
jgi:hypothetical protein